VGAVLSALLAAVALTDGEGDQAFAGPASKLPSIYDKKADGDKQIADALAIAKRDNKRVLLQFGADWCIWCHKLHDLFETDPLVGKRLESEYVLVLIDIDEVDGKKHNADVDLRYGRPTKNGLPTLVVLDADGKQLTTQPTEPWEIGDRHNPFKVLAFLKKWQAERVSAQAILSTGLSRAKAETKNVFVYFTAPWCTWCGKLDTFVHSGETAELLRGAYVPVKVDIERTTGGKELAVKYGWDAETGVPFFVIADANGRKLVDSKGENGNVGFPAEPQEIAHFKDVITMTAPGLTAGQVATLVGTFE
jgi:thiol:disulfide interchange protein